MTRPTVAHETIVIERTYDVPAARVYQAWADPEARLRWGPPAPGVGMVFDQTDFRVGGQDISRCGEIDNLSYHVETIYLDIIANSRIVMVETVSKEGKSLSSSLLTVELRADGARTHLVFTDQVAAFDDSDMIAGNRAGWNASLANLARELEHDFMRS